METISDGVSLAISKPPRSGRWDRARVHPQSGKARAAQTPRNPIHGVTIAAGCRRRSRPGCARTRQHLGAAKLSKSAIVDPASIDCVLTIDHGSHITEFNPAAKLAFGYRGDAVTHKALADVVIPPSRGEHHRKALPHCIRPRRSPTCADAQLNHCSVALARSSEPAPTESSSRRRPLPRSLGI